MFMAICGLCFCSCGSTEKEKSNEVMTSKVAYQKKYTNADYYKDGKLDPEVALKAYLDLFDHYGVIYNDAMKPLLWITDFELGDFENVGMGGVIWVNDVDHGYFGHDIYLLPNQMIAEHRHVPTDQPAKFESWQVRHGMVYNFSIGEETPHAPLLPESQKDFITARQFVKQYPNDVVHLKEVETPHFLLAGPEGAIVAEFACYHDGNGLRFTNPTVEFTDILTKENSN